MVVINPGRGPGVWPRQPLSDTLIDTTETGKMSARATLICRPNSHPFQERNLALDNPEKIGRSVARVRAAPNNAIFDCKVLSRNHALLWFESGKFFLRDTKSSNGTFVNSQRLGKGADDSAPRELCSGDIVQFGVDVMENSKKVTHGCIVATLKLFFPDGKEAKARGSTPEVMINGADHATPLHSPELYQLQQCVQEAVHREQAVETKLATLQRLMDGVQAATNSSWKALIDEDRLLTRLEILEGQHALYSKNFGEDKLREEIARLQEEKNTYQNVAKESLKKVLQEKLEAVRRLQEVERSLTSAQDECRCQTELREATAGELAELAAKYEAKLATLTELETKVKELEEEQAAAEERWQAERARLEARDAQQRTEEAQQRARLEGLQAESDFTKQQLAAVRQKLQTKLGEWTPNGDVALESGGMQQTEQELQTVRTQLSSAESQLAAATHTIGQLKDSFKEAEAEISTFKAKASSLEAELKKAQEEQAAKLEEVQKLEQSLKEKESELLKLEKQRSAGDADIKDSQVDVAQLKNKVQTLQELLDETRRAGADCDGRVERYQSQLLVTRNNAQEATLRADHLGSQLKEAESSLAVQSERTEQLQQMVLRLAASVTEAVGQLQTVQQAADQRQQAAEQDRARAEQLRGQLAAAEQRADASDSEAGSMRLQLAELRAQLAAAAGAALPHPEDPEKVELRRQLRRMDEQLKELAVQNRTSGAYRVLPLLVLAWSVCIAFYDWLACLTATREP
ncbi:sarcolemmal membrane-associated protein-like [Pollicipes pollicipes]|uniref:sarcolemmal membrane-associated protein-like n=1 Tax=Pollicipes pollicipes TaxID=41117 RepID=UPI00188555E2|nr:sarcolemmal membrane-associated protein-like [Pollicipes pollicipes]